MISDAELSIFIKELGELIDDYYRCPEESLKEAIYQDILLLGTAISVEDEHCS
ncbi:hypothetical protein [Bacillus badius]|uniref:Uncharacterized protein n=1 Tax=Bacillus badius TaxID=1455 RepID=A0ABR5AZD8_BACBA|nr:hypothetical protein [Bacillus badius]KIL80064.1 hypothetical protein SD77_2518 [Bacillus badius]MED4717907.1 hypothetical protein [Bacillus badius]